MKDTRGHSTTIFVLLLRYIISKQQKKSFKKSWNEYPWYCQLQHFSPKMFSYLIFVFTIFLVRYEWDCDICKNNYPKICKRKTFFEIFKFKKHIHEFTSFHATLHLNLNRDESIMQIYCIIIEKLFLTAPFSHPKEHSQAHKNCYLSDNYSFLFLNYFFCS